MRHDDGTIVGMPDVEVFYLDLYVLSSNALFTKNRGIGTILNDD